MRQIIDKPSPITGGKMELCSEPATVQYRGEIISYEKQFYHCIDSDMEFADDELEAANLKLIYDTYRHFHGIPLAEELKQTRERYGLPLSAMSIILGLGENQYALYEDGAVPTASVGKLLSLAADPATMKEMLLSARHQFSDKLFSKYFSSILSSMQPAQYEIDDVGVLDFGLFDIFPPATCIISETATPSHRKVAYNEYVSYAAA